MKILNFNKYVAYLVYLFLIILSVYQDSPLGKYFGAFGYSFLPVTSLMVLLVLFLIRPIRIDSFCRSLIILLGWLMCVSFIAVIVWFAFGQSMTLLGESVAIKSIKVLLYFASYVAFVIVISNLTIGFSEKMVLSPFFITLILLVVIGFIEYRTMPFAFTSLHFNSQIQYHRIRLLTQESSWTTMMIYAYSVLSIYFTRFLRFKKFWLSVTVLAILFLIGITSSKTLLVAIILTLAISLILRGSNLTRKGLIQLVVMVIVGAIVLLFLMPRINTAFTDSYESSGSIVTRGYTITIAALISILFPFGTGTAVYLELFPSMLGKFITVFNLFPNHFILSEIYSYIYAVSDESVTAKSGLLQYSMYWGVLGTLLFLFFLKKYILNHIDLKHNHDLLLLKSAVIVSILLLIFSNDFTFEFWALMTVALKISLQQSNGLFASSSNEKIMVR